MNKEDNSSAEKPFNFLDFIKNPQKSDEKKTELFDYVSNLNKEQPLIAPALISLIPEEEKSYSIINSNNRQNPLNDYPMKEFYPETYEKNLELGEKNILQIEKEIFPLNNQHFEKNLENIKQFISQSKEINLKNQMLSFENKEINKINQGSEYNNLKDINLSYVPCPPEFQKINYLNDIEPDSLEESKQNDFKTNYFSNNSNNNEMINEYNNPISNNQTDNLLIQQEKENAENLPENLEPNPEYNQPSLIYGHTLEDIIYNVNNLRGQLNQLRRVSEDAGIDISYLQSIDQSFSKALTGIQQRFQDSREILFNHQENGLPEFSEEVLQELFRELPQNANEEEQR